MKTGDKVIAIYSALSGAYSKGDTGIVKMHYDDMYIVELDKPNYNGQTMIMADAGNWKVIKKADNE